jgi:hypothetical protein
LSIDNRWLAEIKTNINDQVGHQWFIAHWEAIAVQLISTKSICRGRPKAGSIAGGQKACSRKGGSWALGKQVPDRSGLIA